MFLFDYLLPPTDASPATLNILTAVSSVRIIAVHRVGGWKRGWLRAVEAERQLLEDKKKDG